MRQLKISKQITNRDDLSLDKYLSDINKISLITAEEEVELVIKIREGHKWAFDKLTTANLRFVVSVAKQYQNKGLSLTDLISEGNVGILKAALKFDETRGFKFISYAVWWIRQAIIQAIAENNRVVRLPLNKISIINKMKQAIGALEQTHNRPPSPQEIADYLDVSLSEIEICIGSSKRNVSMDQSIADDNNLSRYDFFESEEFPTPEAGLMSDSLKSDLQAVLNTLSMREKEIIKLYYGIGLKTPMSLVEIGELLDITRERVRQIKESAIVNIKSSGRSNILMKYLG